MTKFYVKQSGVNKKWYVKMKGNKYWGVPHKRRSLALRDAARYNRMKSRR